MVSHPDLQGFQGPARTKEKYGVSQEALNERNEKEWIMSSSVTARAPEVNRTFNNHRNKRHCPRDKGQRAIGTRPVTPPYPLPCTFQHLGEVLGKRVRCLTDEQSFLERSITAQGDYLNCKLKPLSI